jgi:hypothetical protein
VAGHGYKDLKLAKGVLHICKIEYLYQYNPFYRFIQLAKLGTSKQTKQMPP